MPIEGHIVALFVDMFHTNLPSLWFAGLIGVLQAGKRAGQVPISKQKSITVNLRKTSQSFSIANGTDAKFCNKPWIQVRK